jgi:hypothetical protein
MMLIPILAKNRLRELSGARRFEIVIITCLYQFIEYEGRPDDPGIENWRLWWLLAYSCKFRSGLTQYQPDVGRVVRQNCA